MTFGLSAAWRRAGRAWSPQVLRHWLPRRPAATAAERLDDRMRRDIGLPVRGTRLLSRHDTAGRITLMTLR